MKLTVSKLKALHADIITVLEKHLARPAPIRNVQKLVFDESTEGNKTLCTLSNHGSREMGKRTRGADQPVYCLPGFDELEPRPWVGWHDEWEICEDEKGMLELVGASITFFWGLGGLVGGRQKSGVMRAEWDHVGRRGADAAQPHWHIDTRLMVGFDIVKAPKISSVDIDDGELCELEGSSESSLIELSSTAAIQDLDASGMHLGMGGWKQPGAHSARWQCRVADARDLVAWADHALEYAISEFRRLSAAEMVIA